MNRLKHALFDALRFIGMRDRLRCPECNAVGTYKPHGGFFDFEDVRKEARWICKWCGHYEGPEGKMTARPNPAGYWDLDYPGHEPPDFIKWKTPRELVRPINPWKG